MCERTGPWAKVAFVTFREPYALETAALLNGATIAEQQVCIFVWEGSEEALRHWEQRAIAYHCQSEQEQTRTGSLLPSAGQAANAVKTLLSKGYVLGKDALAKAQELDRKYQVTASAAAKVSSVSRNLGITDRINAGADTVRSVDTRYGISEKGKYVGEKSKTAFVAAGQAVSSAGSAVVNSSYFASGAMKVSNVLSRAAKAAADLATRSHK
eukprot:TRINITY_DN1948_c0_g1_i4.p1 TRINITY_DN1948_c0_g1~~TRINITY_DN1948_c0_g1_i4.p1  ORF type:complete len:212 (-),score=30.37 TRINITY_DN1948_c0_g1_i4:142-777(-)